LHIIKNTKVQTRQNKIYLVTGVSVRIITQSQLTHGIAAGLICNGKKQ